MIRHRPEGRGHAYLVEPDQRLPVQPVSGERLELRATTADGVSQLWLELEREGRSERIEAVRVRRVPAAVRPAGEATHLSVAADGSGRGRRPEWKVILAELDVHESFRYRFAADDGSRTRWHSAVAAAWTAEGGVLELAPASEQLVPESVSWLNDGSTVHYVRFALRLEPDAHVVGFGERFDALDQRGRALDSVVFEQYKSQGARTYMPMPFAIVVGGGWGFHIATSRRVWFDVGHSDNDLIWIDEALTPDSSRFWPAAQYKPGGPQPSFDKQFVRDYLERVQWSKTPPGPELPAEVVAATRAKYREAYRILAGRELD